MLSLGAFLQKIAWFNSPFSFQAIPAYFIVDKTFFDMPP
jgi:hypothetical protein